MIIKGLVFLWVFLLPILSFLWGLFYRKKDIIPPLNKTGIKEFHRDLFLHSLIIPIVVCLVWLPEFIRDYERWQSLYMIKIPLWIMCLVEIMYLDMTIAIMFGSKNNFSFKNLFSWRWIKDNWPMIEASLPCQNILNYIHLFIVAFSVYNLGPVECKFILILYPITSYFYAKRVYTYYVFQKKGFCKLNREED